MSKLKSKVKNPSRSNAIAPKSVQKIRSQTTGRQISHRQTKHAARRSAPAKTIWKFLILLAILAAYLIWSIHQYGASSGLGVTLLTWTLFVLATPIAIGGFIVAFPTRLLFGVKMWKTQIVVMVVAIAANVLFLIFNPAIYGVNFLLTLFEKILLTPWPYWSLLILGLGGSLVSIVFGDEVFDAVATRVKRNHARVHKHLPKIKWILTVVLYAAAVVIYIVLLKNLGVDIPLF